MTGLKPGHSISCPRCVQGVLPGEDSCQHCGYSLDEADAHFGRGPVAVERLTDADGLFTAGERAEIGAVQREFERRFPQLFLMVYVGSLPSPSSPRQFGFWLLNQAAVSSLDALRPNENGLLLVVNPAAGNAALTAGYFLECCLGQEAVNQALEAGRKALAKGRYVLAVQKIADWLTARICRAAKDPGTVAAPVPMPPGGGGFPGLTRLKNPGGTSAEAGANPETESVSPGSGTGSTPDSDCGQAGVVCLQSSEPAEETVPPGTDAAAMAESGRPGREGGTAE